MPKINCASAECKYQDDNGFCTYEGTINLAVWGVKTVDMGYKWFHECKMFEESDEIKKIQKEFEEAMKKLF